MKKMRFLFLAVLCFAGVAAVRAESRLGVGLNYWVSLDDFEVDDIDDSGFSYLLSFQNRGDLLGFELNLEFAPSRFGEDAWAPQAYLIVGKALYAGAGVGIMYTDSSFADDPFFALKAGFDLEILSNLFLDLSANYRFRDRAQFDNSSSNIDTDTVFLGAALRIRL